VEKFNNSTFKINQNDATFNGFPEPFEKKFKIPDDENSDVKLLYNREEWRGIDERWLELSSELALKLDSHTNNTSLALAIELGKNGKVLLFPGDAQVGNWLSWENLRWSVNGQTITIDDLLKRVVLYKVGHHGSHNATLKEKGLEKMTSDELAALMPVSEKFARDEKKWPIPHEPLLEELKIHCKNRVIRSDQDFLKESKRPFNLNKQQWKEFTKRVTSNELYVEYKVKF
jgi:hypothetical protein